MMIFVDRMKVKHLQHMGDDATIVNAARVSTDQKIVELVDLKLSDERLIRRLIEDRHTSTLEHCMVTLHLDVTLDVISQWERHRTQSYNEKSGRYVEFEPRFYIEPEHRPLGQTGKSMDYERQHLAGDQIKRHRERAERSTRDAYYWYKTELNDGVCKEVARRRLPLNTMTQAWATANLNNWFKFLELRMDNHALYEIHDAADQVFTILRELYPIAVDAWVKSRPIDTQPLWERR